MQSLLIEVTVPSNNEYFAELGIIWCILESAYLKDKQFEKTIYCSIN